MDDVADVRVPAHGRSALRAPGARDRDTAPATAQRRRATEQRLCELGDPVAVGDPAQRPAVTVGPRPQRLGAVGSEQDRGRVLRRVVTRVEHGGADDRRPARQPLSSQHDNQGADVVQLVEQPVEAGRLQLSPAELDDEQ